MHTLIFGAGAVGCYLGANLLEAGWPVTFLGRQETVRSLQEHGLMLNNGQSSRRYQDIDALHSVDSATNLQPELILLTVKAYDCQSAAEQIRRMGWGAPVASFINGIGSEAMLANTLPNGQPIIAATLTTAVERPQPSIIHVAKSRGLGLGSGSGPAAALGRAFTSAGLKVRFYSDHESMKWSKLVSNLIGNASSALTGLTVEEIYSHRGLFRLELAMLREARLVMRAAGVKPLNLPAVPIRWLALALQLPSRLLQPLLRPLVASGRGGKRPSMYYDVARGQTEVQWLNGAVVQVGVARNVNTPANRILRQGVLDLAPGDRLKPEALLAQAAKAGVPGLAVYNRSGT